MAARLALFVVVVGIIGHVVRAQSEPPRVAPRRISVLVWHDSPNDRLALRGVNRGLAVMNLAGGVERLDAKEDEAAARRLLLEARGRGTELFVALGTRAAQIAKATITDRPVVFTAVTNPVLSGVTPDWRGSGSNLAGTSSWLDRRAMLRAFRLALPGMKTLGVVRSPANAVSRTEIEEARGALASQPGLRLKELVVERSEKVAEVLERGAAGIDALWIPIDYELYQERPLRAALAVAKRRRIPVFSSTPKCIGAGAVVVITVDYELLGLKAALQIREILERGAAPGKLAVGRMRSSRLFVDLAAAREIGLALPYDLVLGAHRLIGAEALR